MDNPVIASQRGKYFSLKGNSLIGRNFSFINKHCTLFRKTPRLVLACERWFKQTRKVFRQISVIDIRVPQIFRAVPKVEDVTIEDYMIS